MFLIILRFRPGNAALHGVRKRRKIKDKRITLSSPQPKERAGKGTGPLRNSATDALRRNADHLPAEKPFHPPPKPLRKDARVAFALRTVPSLSAFRSSPRPLRAASRRTSAVAGRTPFPSTPLRSAPQRRFTRAQKEKTTLAGWFRIRFFLWEHRDSNPGPSACKADALNQLSYTPSWCNWKTLINLRESSYASQLRMQI